MDEPVETERSRLAAQLRNARAKAGLSLRDLGEIIGVSSSTLSRVENETAGTLDFDNEVRIKRWLNIPLSVGTVTATGNTLDNIKAAIDADESLDRHVADALYDLMAVAYRRLAKK